jgi:hypothetical protein
VYKGEARFYATYNDDVFMVARSLTMSAEEIKEVLLRKPFEPFRLVMADGAAFDIRHPDLLWVGQRTVMFGFTSDP